MRFIMRKHRKKITMMIIIKSELRVLLYHQDLRMKSSQLIELVVLDMEKDEEGMKKKT